MQILRRKQAALLVVKCPKLLGDIGQIVRQGVVMLLNVDIVMHGLNPLERPSRSRHLWTAKVQDIGQILHTSEQRRHNLVPCAECADQLAPKHPGNGP